LVLVDVKFTREGPRKAYRTILKILQGLRRQIAELQLEDVTVDTGDARVTALLSQARKSGSSMEGTRLTRNAFDGKLIEDVYIYRLRRAA
jgi:hypothetical protein